jgi:hypothetical protein
MVAVKEKSDAVLEEAKKEADCGINPLCAIPAKLEAVKNELMLALQALQTVVTAWLLGVLLLVVGMAAAGYILFNLERVAMSFIGGFVASGVRQVMGRASLGGRMYTGGGVGRAAAAGAAGAAAASPEAIPINARPVVYDMQPYYGGGYRSGGEVIEGEWRTVRELPYKPSRALPPSSGSGGTPPALPPGPSDT